MQAGAPGSFAGTILDSDTAGPVSAYVVYNEAGDAAEANWVIYSLGAEQAAPVDGDYFMYEYDPATQTLTELWEVPDPAQWVVVTSDSKIWTVFMGEANIATFTSYDSVGTELSNTVADLDDQTIAGVSYCGKKLYFSTQGIPPGS